MALIQFTYGPRCGQQQHCSRETADALITGGFAELVEKAPDTCNLSRQKLLHPEPGWKLLRMVDAQGREHYNIVLDDGVGGRIVYQGIPPKTKVWRYDPQTEQEGYILEDSGCPAALISQWQTLNREDVNHEAIAEKIQHAKDALGVQMKEQARFRGY